MHVSEGAVCELHSLSNLEYNGKMVVAVTSRLSQEGLRWSCRMLGSERRCNFKVMNLRAVSMKPGAVRHWIKNLTADIPFDGGIIKVIGSSEGQRPPLIRIEYFKESKRVYVSSVNTDKGMFTPYAFDVGVNIASMIAAGRLQIDDKKGIVDARNELVRLSAALDIGMGVLRGRGRAGRVGQGWGKGMGGI